CATDQHIAARPAQGAEPFARERHVQPLREQPQLFGIARPLCNHVNEQVAHAFFHSLVYARSEDLSRIVPELLGKELSATKGRDIRLERVESTRARLCEALGARRRQSATLTAALFGSCLGS